MNSPYWIELKRTDFLDALKSLKLALRVKGSPARDLQIGLIDGEVVFSVQGGTASSPASGNWPGLASLPLTYFLTFLVAKPSENPIRMTFADGKVHLSTARFPAKWVDSNDLLTGEQLHEHAVMPGIEEILKFKCPKCRRKKGVAFVSLSAGSFTPDGIKNMLHAGESLGHAFGCLACSATWVEQVV